MSVSSINSAMQSRGMYCASPQSVRQMQAPRGQISSMQADPSAYAAADNSLSPSGEPSWWDTTVQWVQAHVPETILGTLVAVGGIAVSVWALRRGGGGKNNGKLPGNSSTVSPSNSSLPQTRRRRSDTGTPQPPPSIEEAKTVLDADLVRLKESSTKYNKEIYGMEEPSELKTTLIGGAVGGLVGLGASFIPAVGLITGIGALPIAAAAIVGMGGTALWRQKGKVIPPAFRDLNNPAKRIETAQTIEKRNTDLKNARDSLHDYAVAINGGKKEGFFGWARRKLIS